MVIGLYFGVISANFIVVGLLASCNIINLADLTVTLITAVMLMTTEQSHSLRNQANSVLTDI